MTPDFRAIILAALIPRSVYWLSQQSGVGQPALHKWLSGEQATINSHDLERVAAALALDLRRSSGRLPAPTRRARKPAPKA